MNKPKTTITAWPLNDDWNSATGSWSRNTFYSEVAAEYTLSSHVDALIAEARDAALVEAAAKSYDPNYIEIPEVDIRDAMQDLLNAPKGVVPDSAAQFYDAQRGTFSTAAVREFLEACQR